MNCSNWEERIALYAGGDLAPVDAAEVEQHLGDCPGCQVFASGLMESLELLQAAHVDPIAPAHFAAVRARVLAELEGARRPWWRKAWVYGLAAAALALFLILAQRPTPPQRQVAVGWQAKAPAPPKRNPLLSNVGQALSPANRPNIPKHRHRPRPRILPVAAPVDPGPPVVVKLLTDDPDVIIYWITDRSGELK